MISIIYLLMIYYLRATSHLDYKEWDVDTVTVADYSAQMKISDTMWNNFKKEKHDRPFNIFIKEEIQDMLKTLPAVYDAKADIEIASISFAFKNRAIIKSLTKRGNLLTNARFNEVVKIDDEINKILKS
jgi:hypothetical protein